MRQQTVMVRVLGDTYHGILPASPAVVDISPATEIMPAIARICGIRAICPFTASADACKYCQREN